MSILANKMTAADSVVEILSVPSGHRTTFNINAVNTGADDAAVSLFATSRQDVGVTSITVTDGGSNYVAIPAVAISGGGGQGATGAAVMRASTVSITNGGTGYSLGDTLSVVMADQTAAVITVNDVDGSGVIQAAELTSGGTYSVLPASPAVGTGGTGSGATFVLTFAVQSVTITAAGSGFLSDPAVAFSTGGANAVAGVDAILSAKHTVEHMAVLTSGGILYRTALILGQGDRLYAQADTDTVAVTAWGVSALI